MESKMVFVCDTSVIVDGRILDLVREGKVSGRVVVPRASVAELEHQANSKKETGFAGLDVLQKLRELQKDFDIELSFDGERPTGFEIGHAKSGEIDAKIRNLAGEIGATLVTGDKVQHEVALVEGISVIYLRSHEETKGLSFEQYFAPDTMSVHIKEGQPVVSKSGKPGSVVVKEVGAALSTNEVRDIAKEIVEATERNRDYYFEIEREGATVIQMGKYRIVITKPPFSDGFEITLVRPIAKFKLADYEMSDRLRGRLTGAAEGIIICGPPGSGKSTFAAALANHYYSLGKVVKTMESPRDLQVDDGITQYGPLEGSFELTNDIMLLVRPDYSVYDEMRKTVDFAVYADMRMAGIGLVGVLHANKAIDAVQRFINRVELGMIPNIIDTIVLIKGGRVAKVYSMGLLVRVPTGMIEEDLARPVIEVRDFDTDKLEYEIYKFGEETVVLPITQEMVAKQQKLSEPIDEERVSAALEKLLAKIVRRDFQIEFEGRKAVLLLDERDMASVIGKGGKNISQLEKKAGVKIDVRQL
jgi:ATPase